MSDASLLSASDPLWVAAPEGWRGACFSLPAARALAADRPIHLICPNEQSEFWEAAKLGEVHSYDPSISPRNLSRALPEIGQCLIWEPGVVAQTLARNKVPKRLGLPAPSLVKLLTDPIERTVRPGPPEHGVRRFLDTAGSLGAGPFQPIHFSPLDGPGSQESGSILISPESDFGKHYEWPVERWVGLLERWLPDGAQAIILGSGALASQLAQATGIESIERLEPRGFTSFSHGISADSSVPHIAAAFGVTCAVLYGPGDPEQTRPLGKQHLAIRRKVECSPCMMSRCPLDMRCQNDLSVDRVTTALEGFIPS